MTTALQFASQFELAPAIFESREACPRRRVYARNPRELGSNRLHRYSRTREMNRRQLLDLYFLEARSKLIDLGAFLDRVDRAEGEADFRLTALTEALKELRRSDANRAENILLKLSDPTSEPILAATTKAACGAWLEK